jgi:hypothetical protein
LPLDVIRASQYEPRVVPAGRSNVSVQPLTAVLPLLVMV